MKPTLVVLAAGLGSRYGGVKQMEGFGPNGEWILEYSVFDAITAGFGKIVFVLRESILDDFKTYFEQRLPKNIKREYVLQELTDVPNGFTVPTERKKPWGTGHAVLAARYVVDSPFVVINADDFYGADAFTIMFRFLSDVDITKRDYSMVGYYLKNTLSENGSVARGVCTVNYPYLVTVEEHTKIQRQADGTITNEGEGSKSILNEESIVSMNFWGFTPPLFESIEQSFQEFLAQKGQEEQSEFYIPSVVQESIKEQIASVQVFESPQKWFGVTYPEDKTAVVDALKQLHEAGKYPNNLWQ